MASYTLRRAGFTVDIVADGLAAVEACRTTQYRLVLMDWQLPEIDWLEATRRIRGLNIAQPSIIAVTAHALPGDREKCFASGMDDYLSKPYEVCDLLSIVRRHLETSGRVSRDGEVAVPFHPVQQLGTEPSESTGI